MSFRKFYNFTHLIIGVVNTTDVGRYSILMFFLIVSRLGRLTPIFILLESKQQLQLLQQHEKEKHNQENPHHLYSIDDQSKRIEKRGMITEVVGEDSATT
jgi:hypothetical protein